MCRRTFQLQFLLAKTTGHLIGGQATSLNEPIVKALGLNVRRTGPEDRTGSTNRRVPERYQALERSKRNKRSAAPVILSPALSDARNSPRPRDKCVVTIPHVRQNPQRTRAPPLGMCLSRSEEH